MSGDHQPAEGQAPLGRCPFHREIPYKRGTLPMGGLEYQFSSGGLGLLTLPVLDHQVFLVLVRLAVRDLDDPRWMVRGLLPLTQRVAQGAEGVNGAGTTW